ncbi:hypothetical protein Sbal117_2520 [Shewanella baltica OS117]|nr:hypothetical protein Sbal117_2520 [Shewanella baltica OS117]
MLPLMFLCLCENVREISEGKLGFHGLFAAGQTHHAGA